MEVLGLKVFLSIGLLSLLSLFGFIYRVVVLKPRKLRLELVKQGINGPTPSFLYGNINEMKRIQSMVKVDPSPRLSHDYYPSVFPYFQQWKKEYGSIFIYSTGIIQNLYVGDPVKVKDITMNTSLDLGKPTYLQKERGPLFGHGILTSNGSLWAHQRKIIAPQFFMDKVKGMVNLMVESAVSLVESWETRIETQGGVGKITVDADLRSFSADIISKACFGSSYSKGKDIFQRLRSLQMVMSKQGLLLGVPGLRYLPTKSNRVLWKLEKEVGSLILKVVNERKEAKASNDLLQMILEGANNDEVRLDSIDRFIVDNCKSIYFAGHETTATTASWILLLLATHQDWQARVRQEVVEICGGALPNVDMLRKMKQLTMVIQETLRLYPPAPFVTREALQGTQFGDLYVPKGVSLWLPIIPLHQETEIWGPDALEFNPNRFSNGISKACKVPQVYIPFGTGPRTCAGQNFAMVEMKILISLILSRFSFTPSPSYRHRPAFSLVIEPKDGVELIVKKL